ncbi:putative membrane protein DUF2142 [Labedella gwakjiensis]|nr:DUF2142 domain-containing protein [Labedella gwakjiensis]PSL38784.1 putative membrane protein DUF2142 [Labedella gwakjiensis]
MPPPTPQLRTDASSRVGRIVGHPGFFWITVALFTASGWWIALSVNHDLLFDEGYHMAIVRIFSDQWSPFIVQTPDQAWLGDLSRFGSYLYHYVMAVPLRLLRWSGADLDTQYVVLRALTVLLVSASLWWFRRTLLLCGIGRGTAQLAIFLFAALPLTSFVAATINYDNALLLLAAVFFALTARILTIERVSGMRLLGLVAVGCLACLAKFTFLPVFLVCIVGICVVLLRRRRLSSVRALTTAERPDRRRPLVTVGVVALAIVAVGLFAERYLVSLIAFNSPQPDCDAIHSEAFCRNYGPWERNAQLDDAFPDRSASLVDFASYALRAWVPTLVKTFSTVGWAGGYREADTVTATVIATAAAAVLLLCAVAIPRVVRSAPLAVLALAFVVLVASLLVRNYGEYLRLGVVLAVSGRYILPFIPLALGVAGVGAGFLLSRTGRWRPPIEAVVAVVAVLGATQGGFAIAFLAAAQPDWLSPASPLASITPALQAVARFLMIGI